MGMCILALKCVPGPVARIVGERVGNAFSGPSPDF